MLIHLVIIILSDISMISVGGKLTSLMRVMVAALHMYYDMCYFYVFYDTIELFRLLHHIASFLLSITL